MDIIFAQLGWLTTNSALLATASLVALAIILWEWRLALVSLLAAQISVVTLAVREFGVASEWGMVQVVVMALCCMILAISAGQRPGGHRMYLAGSTFLRATALALILLTGYLFQFDATLPLLDGRTTQLFAWLAVSALLMLGLGDSALFSAVGLLQWSIVAQAVVEVLLRLPGLVSVIGVLELMIALACSYLILTESISLARPTVVATDVDPRSRIQLAGQVQRAEAARRTGEFAALPITEPFTGRPASDRPTSNRIPLPSPASNGGVGTPNPLHSEARGGQRAGESTGERVVNARPAQPQ